MGQFSNSFPKHFSYPFEYAIRFDLSCSFCEYPFIFHFLHCSPSCFDPDSLLLAYLWLGLSWIDCISATKTFSSPKTSSRKPYTSSKQQERHKHSVEITINFSRPSPDCPPTGRAVRVRHQRALGAGVWVWGPNTVPFACMPCWGCMPRGWWRAVPGGVASHRCEGRLVSGAVPPPAARPLERAAGVPRPVCPGCGPCGRGDPAPAPQRAPLRAGVARCGVGGKASPGGVPSTIVGGRLKPGAVPPPTARALGGLLGSATHVLWAQVCGCGSPTLSARPACPMGANAAGMVGGRPRGGWPATVVRGAWCQALSLPRPPVLWSGQPGFRDPCVPGAVGAGVGTQHRPHSVRPCGPALLAVGVAGGHPRGGCLPPL